MPDVKPGTFINKSNVVQNQEQSKIGQSGKNRVKVEQARSRSKQKTDNYRNQVA